MPFAERRIIDMNIEHCHVFSFTYFNVKADVILSFIKDAYKDDFEKDYATLIEESLILDTFIEKWISKITYNAYEQEIERLMPGGVSSLWEYNNQVNNPRNQLKGGMARRRFVLISGILIIS